MNETDYQCSHVRGDVRKIYCDEAESEEDVQGGRIPANQLSRLECQEHAIAATLACCSAP